MDKQCAPHYKVGDICNLKGGIMLIVKQETVFRFLLPALVLLVLLVRLIDGFWPGVLLAPTPDSVEPFVGALRMCQGEKYGFTLNGEFFPSRYSPALSFLLMPALYISSSPAAAGAAIGLWAMVLVLFVVLLFHKDKEYGGTALACGSPLLFGVLRFVYDRNTLCRTAFYHALAFQKHARVRR